MDSEWKKMMLAEKAGRNRTHGFQGCANYGKGCDFDGFYGYNYSEEGLCSKCEFKQFPERYHGCCFCRKAIQHSASCINCRGGFQRWAFDLFYNKSEKSQSTSSRYIEGEDETNDWKFYNIVKIGIAIIAENFHLQLPFLVNEEAKYTGTWSGFYTGDGKWIKPDPFELKSKIDITDITWENKEEVLNRELAKLGISLFAEKQI